MEIDITVFVTGVETWDFSGSIATHGPNAGPNTWRAAKKQAADSPLLETEEQLQAMRDWALSSGGWDEKEIDAWSDEDLNALFIQLISGDMRESGMDNYCVMDGSDPDCEFDWEAYQEDVEAGHISGNIYKSADRIFYYLGS
jgi:hypothetical protein